MSSFLKKEALCVCRNKLVIVLDCGSSTRHKTDFNPVLPMHLQSVIGQVQSAKKTPAG